MQKIISLDAKCLSNPPPPSAPPVLSCHSVVSLSDWLECWSDGTDLATDSDLIVPPASQPVQPASVAA